MKTRAGIQPDEYPNLTVGKATKLAAARDMQVNLASGNAQSFDGSGNATEIGVKGVLPVANGGTGASDLDNITVGRAIADGSGNNIENTYVKNNMEITDLNNITQQSGTWQAYLCESAANQPVDGGGLLFQYCPSAEWLAQLFIANDAESTTWRRNYRANSGWTAWQKVLTGASPQWVTGTSESLKLSNSGWYIIQATTNLSGGWMSSGVVYWDSADTRNLVIATHDVSNSSDASAVPGSIRVMGDSSFPIHPHGTIVLYEANQEFTGVNTIRYYKLV